MFTVATWIAALLNDAIDGNPRFTVFAFGLCLLGALALVSLICVIMTAVRRVNDGA